MRYHRMQPTFERVQEPRDHTGFNNLPRATPSRKNRQSLKL